MAGQRLTGCRFVAVVAIAHKVLQKRIKLIARRAEPGGGPEPLAGNHLERAEPENLVRESGDCAAQVLQAPRRGRDDQDAELAASEDLCELTGGGQLQILAGLFGDDWNGFGAEVNFYECGPETLL